MSTLESKVTELQTVNAELVEAVNEQTGEVIGKMGQIDQRVEQMEQEVSGFLAEVKSVGHVITEKNTYRTIARFRHEDYVSAFRMVISGTIPNFVYGGIFDVLCSHASHLEIVQVASSAYGTIRLKVVHDESGNGSIAVMRTTGNEGEAPFKITLIPYSGNAVVYDGPMDELPKVYEGEYS